MKNFNFVALAFVSYASYNPVKAEGFDDIFLTSNWSILFDLYKREKDEKICEYMGHVKNELVEYFEEEGKMEIEHHCHEAVDPLATDPLATDPLAALKEDAALAELM